MEEDGGPGCLGDKGKEHHVIWHFLLYSLSLGHAGC